jgi:hypothetical protein
MTTVQSMIGFLILVFGAFAGITSSNYFVLISSIVGGCVLISLSRLIDINKDASHKLLGIPLTKSQINTIINHSPNFSVESSFADVYPEEASLYPLIKLDDDYYIRAKVFYTYMSQQEYEYTFDLPGKSPFVFSCSSYYYKDADLFEHGDQVFVKLAALGIKPVIYKDRLLLKFTVS